MNNLIRGSVKKDSPVCEDDCFEVLKSNKRQKISSKPISNAKNNKSGNMKCLKNRENIHCNVILTVDDEMISEPVKMSKRLSEEDELFRLRLQLGNLSAQETDIQLKKASISRSIKRLIKKINSRKQIGALEDSTPANVNINEVTKLLFRRSELQRPDRIERNCELKCPLWRLAQLINEGVGEVECFDETKHAVLPNLQCNDSDEEEEEERGVNLNPPSKVSYEDDLSAVSLKLSSWLKELQFNLKLDQFRIFPGIENSLDQLFKGNNWTAVLDELCSHAADTPLTQENVSVSFEERLLQLVPFQIKFLSNLILGRKEPNCKTTCDANGDKIVTDIQRSDAIGGLLTSLIVLRTLRGSVPNEPLGNTKKQEPSSPETATIPKAQLLLEMNGKRNFELMLSLAIPNSPQIPEAPSPQSEPASLESTHSTVSSITNYGLMEGGCSTCCQEDGCSDEEEEEGEERNPQIIVHENSMEMQPLPMLTPPDDIALMEFIDVHDSIYYDDNGHFRTGCLHYTPHRSSEQEHEKQVKFRCRENDEIIYETAPAARTLATETATTVAIAIPISESIHYSAAECKDVEDESILLYSTPNSPTDEESFVLPSYWDDMWNNSSDLPDFSMFSLEDLQAIGKSFGLKPDSKQRIITVLQTIWKRVKNSTQ